MSSVPVAIVAPTEGSAAMVSIHGSAGGVGFGSSAKTETDVEETEHHAGFRAPICAVVVNADDVPANAENADDGLHYNERNPKQPTQSSNVR